MNNSLLRRIKKIARNKAHRKEAKKAWKESSSQRRISLHQSFLVAKMQLAVLKRIQKQLKMARD